MGAGALGEVTPWEAGAGGEGAVDPAAWRCLVQIHRLRDVAHGEQPCPGEQGKGGRGMSRYPGSSPGPSAPCAGRCLAREGASSRWGC